MFKMLKVKRSISYMYIYIKQLHCDRCFACINFMFPLLLILQNQGKMPTASPTSNNPDALSKTNLYIRGLTPNTTDKDLVNLCHQ